MQSRALIFAFVSMSLAGCGSDKDMAEYDLKRLNDEVAKIQAVAGVYTGSAVKTLNQSNLGDLSIELQADTKIGPSTDTVVATRQAILKGKITLTETSEAYVSFPEGFFDSTSNDASASIPVTRRDGTQSVIHMTGHISNNTLAGTLEVIGFSESLINFTLTKTNPSSVRKIITTQPVGGTSNVYISTGSSFGNATLEVSEHSINIDEQFLDRVTPIQLVDLNLAFDGQLPSLFENVQWDLRNNQIQASTLRSVSQGTTATAAANKEDLKCSYVTLQNNIPGWNCQFRTSKLPNWTPLLFKLKTGS